MNVLLLSAAALLLQSGGAVMSTAERLGYNVTALDEYVAKEDSSYSWFDTGIVLHGASPSFGGGMVGWKGYVLNMTSQTWLSEDEVSRSVWWHTLVVVVPENLNMEHSDWSMLYITWGKNTQDYPNVLQLDVQVAAAFACERGIVTTALYQVPNEPTVFADEIEPGYMHSGRSEDALIAFSWYHFQKNTSNPEAIVNLPMTKASVRAMDTVEAFMKNTTEKRNVTTDIKKWVVSGVSKRGWTAWLVAAVVPDRVGACIPIMMDLLNMIPNMHHMYRAYGGWSVAFKDYWKLNFTQSLDDQSMLDLTKIIDPYWYRERLTMPKFILDSADDEFFMLQDTRYWWNDMPEPMYWLLMPNNDHTAATGFLQAPPAIGAFIKGVQENSIPTFHQMIDDVTGDITIDVGSDTPKKVTMWHSRTCESDKKRDFRFFYLQEPNTVCLCGNRNWHYPKICDNFEIIWTAKPVYEVPGRPGIYVASQETPAKGWTAFFVDVQYGDKENTSFVEKKMKAVEERMLSADGENGWPLNWPMHLEFTSLVSILPNTSPFEDCHGHECKGKLV